MTTIDHNCQFIAGAWQNSHSRERIVVRSASTEAVIGSVPDADQHDIDAAVRAARAAFDEWSRRTSDDRAEVLRSFAEAIDKRNGELAQRVSEQNGMPIFLSTAADVRRPGQFLRYYAQTACDTPGEELRPSST